MKTAVLTSLALLALWAFAASPAIAQQPLESPGSTDRIEPAGSETTADGWTWDLYRNLAYPCSISGYQTFAVGNPPSAGTAPRPLWVRMRGGGVGWFNAAGQPQPSTNNKTEENLDSLIAVAQGNALNRLIDADPAGFRNLAVSLCDHDIFNGGDQMDPNNPYLTPDGAPRTSNGLFATKAAIAYVQDLYPTTRTFLHGTSAGSFGGYGVAWSLQRQDRPVTGFVADSGVVNAQYELDLNAQGSSCARGAEALAAVSARLHPELVAPANQADLLFARGDLTVPVFNIWNREDQLSCGSDQINCTMPDGSVTVMGSMECKMDRVSKAIAALPASSNSRTLRVCVRALGDLLGTCARHVVTDPAGYLNTDPAGPADYLGAIRDWVDQRLGDEPPALEAGLGKRKLKAGGGHVDARCEAGGDEQRTCKVRLQTREGGRLVVLSRSRVAIGPGKADRRVRMDLTDRGRGILRNAPRRGISVHARIRVRELYTGRAGKVTVRVRLLPGR